MSRFSIGSCEQQLWAHARILAPSDRSPYLLDLNVTRKCSALETHL